MKAAVRTIGWPSLVYVLASLFVFRFRHPGLTETQLLLRIFDALIWRNP